MKNANFYKMPVIILILVIQSTFGLYYFLWLLQRIRKFNAISKSVTVNRNSVIFSTIGIFLTPILMFSSFYVVSDSYFHEFAAIIIVVVLMSFPALSWFFFLKQLENANCILNDNLGIEIYSDVEKTKILTLLLGPLYLQHRINKAM